MRRYEKGLKFYLGTTVAWPIGVACDDTDSIFSPGAISCFVYPRANCRFSCDVIFFQKYTNPSEVLFSSDTRPSNNLMFPNV